MHACIHTSVCMNTDADSNVIHTHRRERIVCLQCIFGEPVRELRRIQQRLRNFSYVHACN